jgi:two-component system chemotaxis sensor kinase CheA
MTDPAETFRQEARELVEALEQGLLDLGRAPGDRDLVDGVFRALHTIKGSGAMFGFTEVAEFVHEFETAFDSVRKGQAQAGSELVAVALAGKDHVQSLIEDHATEPGAGEAILKALRVVVGGGAAPAAPEAPAPAQDAPAGWLIRFRLAPDALAFGANPLLLIEELAGLGTCTVRADVGRVPGLDALDPEVCALGWEVRLTGAVPRGAVDDVFMFIADGMELAIEPLEPAPAASGAPAAEAPAASSAPAPGKLPMRKERPAGDKAGMSLRVSTERLDELMDRVGELVIAQARLTSTAAASGDANLKAIAEELERLSSGLRDTTMGIRMVPIGQLFGRFRRLIHDLSRDLGKPIELVTTGEETELDKTMIERLADPLVHIIRNALDHGLENPARRQALGKPATGTVTLAAVYAGTEVAVSVSDDGAGLDAERIRAKAVEAGLIAQDARLPDHELNKLIFEPGFSTAKEVSALSGRGVGMDVVKRTMDSLRGSIDVASVPGKGTRVTLRVPLTLAIIDGLLVQVGAGKYTIPLAAVEECLELPAMAEVPNGGPSFLDVRGALVPYLRLRDLFGTPTPPGRHQKVVIVSSGGMRVGLVVDQIIGNNQTVIKQLSKLHADIKTFFGATILGDGTVALILDVGHLVNFGQAVDESHMIEAEGRAA